MQGHYIVFLIDSKYKDHDGKVFSGYADAKQFASEIISEKYADKAVIGMFVFDGTKEMNITQLNLFIG